MTRILLVADGAMNSDMWARRMERRGFEVLVALDGRQGPATATGQPLDLILMDVKWTAAGDDSRRVRPAVVPVALSTIGWLLPGAAPWSAVRLPRCWSSRTIWASPRGN